MRKIDLLVFLTPLVERKVDDPAKTEGVFFDNIKLFARACARCASKLCCLFFLPGSKEAAVVLTKADCFVKRTHAFFAMVLGNGTAELAALARYITKASMAFASGPFVHIVKKLAAFVSGLRRRNCANYAAAFDNAFKQTETGRFEMTGDVVNN